MSAALVYMNTVRVSKGLHRYQAQHFVVPDLGPNYLQNLSAGDIFVGNR